MTWQDYVKGWVAKIEKDVRIPKSIPRREGVSPPFVELAEAMQPGDSILIEVGDYPSLAKAIYDRDGKVSRRYENGKVRVWRRW